MIKGTGSDIEELAQKPLIAIADSQTDLNPGHMHLETLAYLLLPFRLTTSAPKTIIPHKNKAITI